jgi:hypothetical protein
VAHKALVRIVFERDAFCSINVLYAAVLTIGIMRVWVSKARRQQPAWERFRAFQQNASVTDGSCGAA